MKKPLAAMMLLLSACSFKITNKEIVDRTIYRARSFCETINSDLITVTFFVKVHPQKSDSNLVTTTILCGNGKEYTVDESKEFTKAQ